MSLDPQLPITMLPVRIETRFTGASSAPRLLVRIYPDDVHLDRHDPRLTPAEVAAGRRYWTAVRDGAAPDQAWAQLLRDVGPSRAIWTRHALTPTNASGAPRFPDPAVVDGEVGLPATARALPASFVVRVRHAGGAVVVQGTAIPASLPVGISGATAPASDTDATRVLDEGLRWMVDFDAAVAVGMAVAIDLPPDTSHVDDVVVVGLPIDGADGAAVLAALVEAHRFSDGAAFLAPGTPTNNLADSASGYSVAAVPPPAVVAGPADGTAAGALAAAWGIAPAVLGELDGAGSRALDEARLMSRALFEATWGSYARHHVQPSFDLGLLPELYAHVTSFVRGGGPLPAIRFGRQPYAIAPVMARGTWAPLAEGAFVRWLSGFLPGIRPLWTAGVVDAPAGPDLFAHEPVSRRVRLRTMYRRQAIDYLVSLRSATVRGNFDISRRAILAELGVEAATPSVLTHIFARRTADLWLPMATDGDTAFDLLAPAPKDASSVLGLLLRNAALGIAGNATHEFASLAAGASLAQIARAAPELRIANLQAVAGRTIATMSGFTAEAAVATPAELVAGRGQDAGGRTFVIRDRLRDIVADPGGFEPDTTRYFNSDALAAFRDAVAAIAAIPTARRAELTGEILDCASHRYDAWVTSIASARLAGMRAARAGNQIGAWGAVRGIQRRTGTAVPASDTIPDGTTTDPAGGGFVLAPSPRQASTAGVLRAAWRAHGGAAGDALAPFAAGLTSTAVRRALALAEGMRHGQPLGALLGYLLERGIHDASGAGGIELDWAVFELRRQYPLKVDTVDNAPQVSAARTVADGWKLAQVETARPGAVVAAIPAPSGAGAPAFGATERAALQAVIADVVAVLDAFADLGLAESMYQLAGANLERAAAAADMIGRAAAPPDVFESAITPRGGRGIEQRVVVTFGPGARPSGYAGDTPRARLAPAADAFVARRLGSLDGIHVRLLDAKGKQVAAPLLSALKLSALDLAALELSSEVVALTAVVVNDRLSAADTAVAAASPGLRNARERDRAVEFVRASVAVGWHGWHAAAWPIIAHRREFAAIAEPAIACAGITAALALDVQRPLRVACPARAADESRKPAAVIVGCRAGLTVEQGVDALACGADEASGAPVVRARVRAVLKAWLAKAGRLDARLTGDVAHQARRGTADAGVRGLARLSGVLCGNGRGLAGSAEAIAGERAIARPTLLPMLTAGAEELAARL
jgi:hypothetical protein